MVKNGSVYKAPEVEFAANTGETLAYFNLATALGATWDDVNASDRYGAATEGEDISEGEGSITKYTADINASGCQSWTIKPGIYTIAADLAKNHISATLPTGIVVMTGDGLEQEAVYFNLQGVRVDNPTEGIYIRVTSRGAQKVLF